MTNRVSQLYGTLDQMFRKHPSMKYFTYTGDQIEGAVTRDGPVDNGTGVDVDVLANSVYPYERLGTQYMSIGLSEAENVASALAEHKGDATFTSGADEIYPHLMADFYAAPEGSLIVFGCDRCGGRRESILVAPRFFRRNWTPEERKTIGAEIEAHSGPHYEALRDFTTAQITHGFRPLLAAFIDEHKDCTKESMRDDLTIDDDVDLPPDVRAFLHHAQEVAAEMAAKGDPMRPVLHILGAKGEHLMMPVYDINPKEKRQQYAVRQATVRQMLLKEGIEPLASIITTEAWIRVGDVDEPEPENAPPPSEHPDRQEAMIVLVYTPKLSRTMIGRIVRDGGVPGEGSGTIPSWLYHASRGGGPMPDGWMALPLPTQTLQPVQADGTTTED